MCRAARPNKKAGAKIGFVDCRRGFSASQDVANFSLYKLFHNPVLKGHGLSRAAAGEQNCGL
jgi:hypothetical protein